MTGPYRLDRSLIRISGPDSASFLDNLITQDVKRLKDAGVLYSALLSPQGKVICDMLLWNDGGSVIIETDPSRAADLTRRLSMYKLRAQISVEDITDRMAALYAPSEFAGAAPDPRLPGLGWRKLSASDRDLPRGDAECDARRLSIGAPDLARDAAVEEVFALEGLLEELNGVDFKKGCFVGQENVSRMKRRATTRKKFCPIAFEGEPPPHGATVVAEGVELGTVRTGVNGRAMALLRLDRALEAVQAGRDLAVDGRKVRLDPPPWLILPGGAGEAD
jgi:folate-binding protein YgfZ